MAKKDELAFEGGVDTPQPNNNNSEKLKALWGSRLRQVPH